MSIKLGIFGATGKVGAELLNLLEKLPESELKLAGAPVLFGSARSLGRKIKFKGQDLDVLDCTNESFEGLDVIVSCANGEVSEKIVPKALKDGVKLIVDTDSHYRMDPNVPLVTVGVNDEDIDWHRGIIAGPNCSTAQLIIPLKALHEAFGLKRAVVSTYQSVSGAGKAAMDTLIEETKEVVLQKDVSLQGFKPSIRKQFAFNVIPQISKVLDNGNTKEEEKVIIETRKMLHTPDLKISCTAVRVPVLVGHSESVNVELLNPFTLDQAKDVLRSYSQIQLWEDWNDYPMPVDAAGTEPVHVGRVRLDESAPNALNFWVVADNLLIGAALNALRVVVEATRRGKV
jgi:aspartate-semialdehyde dehydrogenase